MLNNKYKARFAIRHKNTEVSINGDVHAFRVLHKFHTIENTGIILFLYMYYCVLFSVKTRESQREPEDCIHIGDAPTLSTSM